MSEEIKYQDFYNSVKDSYIKYLLFGDRSVEKLKPLHSWIGETIKCLIPKEYEVYFINGKEVQTEGKYYTKIIDVAIVKKDVEVKKKKGGFRSLIYIPRITMAVSLKFITSNFKQNANNYFEVLLGECANLRSKGVKFGHFVVFRDKIPYFARQGRLEHWETLEDKDVNKYIELYKEKLTFPHSPNFIGLEVVNINPVVEEIYKCKPKFSKKKIEKITKETPISVRSGINNTNLSVEIKEFVCKYFNIFEFFHNLQTEL